MFRKIIVKVGISSFVFCFLMSVVAFASTSGTVEVNVLNIRKNPNTSAKIIGKSYYGDQVSILSKEGNWYKIQTTSNEIAYVYSNYIKSVTADTLGRVTVPILNFRSTPSLTSTILGKLQKNELVTIIETTGDWYHVKTKDDKAGYVYRTYIEETTTATAAIATTVTSTSTKAVAETVSSDVRSELLQYAKQFLGNKYVYGGTSLTNGVDCSSFTQQILGHFGYKLSRTSSSQYREGAKISQADLLPGDLVFSGYSGIVSHVGIYVGNGQIVHASTPRAGVTISNMVGGGRKPLIGFVRVIQ